MNIRRGFGLIFPEHRLTLMGGNEYTGQRNTLVQHLIIGQEGERVRKRVRSLLNFLACGTCAALVWTDRFPQLIIQSINLSR